MYVCTLFEGTVRTTENTSATNAVNKESVPQKERKSWFTYALAKTNFFRRSVGFLLNT